MNRSIAYTGPDDWQTVEYWLDSPEDSRLLEIDFDVFRDTGAGDELVITEVRDETGCPIELDSHESARVLEYLRENYQPTEDL